MSRPLNDTVFRAIAHPVRRQILDLLRQGERPAGDIVSRIAMADEAVSQHLRVLRQNGLVTQRRVGRGRVYALNRRAIAIVRQWVSRF